MPSESKQLSKMAMQPDKMSATPEEQFAAEGKVSFPIERRQIKEIQSAFSHFKSKLLPKRLNTAFAMVRHTSWKRIAMGQVGTAEEILFFLANNSESIQKVEFPETEEGSLSVVFSKGDQSANPN